MYSLIGSLFGLVAGSFAGATVWRLRARQLKEDKKSGEEVDKAEYRRLLPLTKQSLAKDRSRCLHCGHTLKWTDLIPLFSWLRTGGKCRYCHKKIGTFEPFMELGSAVLFGTFMWYWSAQHLQGGVLLLAVWVVILVLMVIAFAYDAKWFLLPDVVMVPMIILSFVVALLHIVHAAAPAALLLSTVGAVGILSGLYLVLWLVSGGRWIGFGDVKLGLALGLLLGEWQFALLALFLANFIGLLFVLPGLISGKLSRQAHVPFGPFLIIGFFVTLLWGNDVIMLYESSVTIFANWLITLML